MKLMNLYPRIRKGVFILNSSWIEAISNCLLFRNIEKDQIEVMLNCLEFRIENYKKNEHIVNKEEEYQGVGLVLSGEVAVVKEDSLGNRTVVAMFKKSEIFGEIIAFSGGGFWPSTVIAQTDSTIMFIHPDKVLSICDQACISHKTVVSNIIKLISQRAVMLNKKVEYLTLKSMRGKLSKYILEQHKKTKSLTFSLPINREMLAEFLNVSRPSMSRELCKMRDEGIIDFYKETIKINDLDKLQKMLE